MADWWGAGAGLPRWSAQPSLDRQHPRQGNDISAAAYGRLAHRPRRTAPVESIASRSSYVYVQCVYNSISPRSVASVRFDSKRRCW